MIQGSDIASDRLGRSYRSQQLFVLDFLDIRFISGFQKSAGRVELEVGFELSMAYACGGCCSCSLFSLAATESRD